jgi:hypothetical protein
MVRLSALDPTFNEEKELLDRVLTQAMSPRTGLRRSLLVG